MKKAVFEHSIQLNNDKLNSNLNWSLYSPLFAIDKVD